MGLARLFHDSQNVSAITTSFCSFTPTVFIPLALTFVWPSRHLLHQEIARQWTWTDLGQLTYGSSLLCISGTGSTVFCFVSARSFRLGILRYQLSTMNYHGLHRRSGFFTQIPTPCLRPRGSHYLIHQIGLNRIGKQELLISDCKQKAVEGD